MLRLKPTYEEMLREAKTRRLKVGGNIIYYTGQGIGQGISAAIDAYNWINENEADDSEDIQPRIDEEQ